MKLIRFLDSLINLLTNFQRKVIIWKAHRYTASKKDFYPVTQEAKDAMNCPCISKHN